MILHPFGCTIFLIIALACVVVLIVKRWVIRWRGFVQLSALVLSEVAFLCNKGIPCVNCPLSFGICPIGTTQRLAYMRHFPVYLTLILIGLTGLLFGTLTCGWACPVGFIQDVLHAL